MGREIMRLLDKWITECMNKSSFVIVFMAF